ncbi:unnamed protein product [Cyclocybe aegerita]|uniref:Pentatricopeptide repeat protein n=1 Tax=Cyclocybe aegerita TaxID=1973307 RepID=A0A8S0VQ55_CYCAE|nr:unnamed protein product [Cyclocybe aegerita]
MPFRALRLFAVPTSPDTLLASSLSFASTLQLAAGKAWSRRVAAHSPLEHARKRGVRSVGGCQTASKPVEWEYRRQPGPSRLGNVTQPLSFRDNFLRERGKGTTHETSFMHAGHSAKLHTTASQVGKQNRHQHTRRRQRHLPSDLRDLPQRHPKMSYLAGVTDFDLQLSDYLPSPEDTHEPDEESCDLFDELPPEHHSEVLTPVATAFKEPRPSYLNAPRDWRALCQNLLYLVNVRKPSLSLPALLDYHARYPHHHSTYSYNLLIDLSIKHHSHPIATRLLHELRQSGIPEDIETYKLQVRLYVHQAQWNYAWGYVRSLQRENKLPKDENGRPDMPLPIWLELCRAPKRRRSRRSAQQGGAHDGQSSVPPFDTKSFQIQRQLVNSNRPSRLPPLHETPPYAIYCLVQLMMRAGDRDGALALTEAYFKAIPRVLDTKKMLVCLRVVHIHMAFSPKKSGLPKYDDARKKMHSLLRLHPSLRPTSRTVFLLLSMLRRAKKCGTVAWKQLAFFKSRWGNHLEDRRVLRRVSQLALKEGRMDIVQKLKATVRLERSERRERLLEESVKGGPNRAPTEKLYRLPLRQVYPSHGREGRLWFRHQASIYRQQARRRKRAAKAHSTK